jgi:hypothetical protein
LRNVAEGVDDADGSGVIHQKMLSEFGADVPAGTRSRDSWHIALFLPGI